ncbi:DNA-3-methyladenine glycosylase [Dyadobacter sp. NIV53]|uniref:DNA-3-methyladenine glycosylase family protein n=1 Tax=Dyadobacter sp. NIV53 TaxID=2861765 RepID=UPI001C869908|nr:DNA glycosylase [Dyadobacter sp. NIV53]
MISDRILLIPIPALFSFQECLWFLNRNYDDCLHIIHQHDIMKAIEFEGEIYLVRVTENGSFLEVNILVGEVSYESKKFVSDYIIEWFDMNRNIQPFYDLLKKDGRLAYMAEDFKGLRLLGIENLFEAICWCVIGQQINLTFAYKVKRRLIEKYGKRIEYQGELYFIFPDSDTLANVDIEELRAMQFSQQKINYVVGTAIAFSNGTLSKAIIEELPDFASRKKTLTDQKGIGAWTANYVLMKSLKEPGCIPHGDIGLLNALANHNIIGQRSELDKISAFFETFKGWESYLVFYLWRSLTVRI